MRTDRNRKTVTRTVLVGALAVLTAGVTSLPGAAGGDQVADAAGTPQRAPRLPATTEQAAPSPSGRPQPTDGPAGAKAPVPEKARDTASPTSRQAAGEATRRTGSRSPAKPASVGSPGSRGGGPVTDRATSAAAPPLPVLGGAVTLTGNRAGYVRVRLPKQAYFDRADVGAKDSLVITGGGDMAAFALMRETGRGADLKGPVVVGGHTRRSADVTKRRGEFALTLLRAGPDDDKGGAVLPAGTYRLYLVPDGKATTVRLKLRGLSGSSRLTPKVASPVLVQGGTPRIAREDSNGVLYSEGYETDLTEQSLHFKVSVARNQAHAGTSSWDCLFDHKPEGPDPYLPGCPTAGNGNSLAFHAVYADQSVGPGEIISYGGVVTSKGGPVGSGMSLLSAAAVDDIDYQHFWLGLGL